MSKFVVLLFVSFTFSASALLSKDSGERKHISCNATELNDPFHVCNCTAASDPVKCCNSRFRDTDVCWKSVGCRWGLEARTCVWNPNVHTGTRSMKANGAGCVCAAEGLIAELIWCTSMGQTRSALRSAATVQRMGPITILPNQCQMISAFGMKLPTGRAKSTFPASQNIIVKNTVLL